MLMKWKSLFAAALSAAVALPAWAQDATGGGSTSDSTDGTVISLSFANGRADQSEIINVSEGETAVGLAPVPGNQWTNLSQSGVNNNNKTISVTDAAVSAAYDLAESAPVTLPVPVKVSFSAKNAWSILGKQSSPAAPSILHAYLDDGAPGASVTVEDIPFSAYDVIVYFATDNARWTSTDGVEGSGGDPMQFQPVTVNNKLYSWRNGALVSGDAATNVLFGQSLQDTVAEGTNALRIPNLSGATLTIQGGTGFTDGGYKKGRGCIAAVQIVCTGEVIVPPPPSINVNFASGRVGGDTSHDRALTGATTYGLEPVPGSEWKNLYKGDRNNDVALAVCNGETSVVPTVTYNASGMWSYEEDIEDINDLLFAALDDASALSGTSNNTTITVSDVPFTQYDVIVYVQAVGNGGGFKPVEVNGSYYAWQDGATQAVADSSDTYAWGTLSQPQPALGVNALRISGQTARELTINAPVRTGDANNSKRCNVTGFQIVCTGKVIEELIDPTKEGVISLNFNSGTNNSAVPATETTYGLVAVPGSKWQNLTGTSNADDVAIITASNTDLTVTPTVTFSSKGGYQYNADQATCPYLRAYLDDDGSTKVTGVDVDVANVPYQAYDVVVYFGMADENNTFRPVAINGTYYRWDNTIGTTVPTEASGAAFGTSAQPEAAYGVNAIRVKAQTDDNLDLDAQPRNPSAGSERGGIAALQLVERKVIKVTGTGFDLASALAAYYDDTPVLITFAEGATVAGDVTLPDDAVVDLTDYTFGETAPFGGALTVNAGTEIRLPGGAVSYTLASSINGTLGLVMQGDTYITDAPISEGTITCPVTYEWTGNGADNNWSTRANWSSGVVPGADSEVTVSLNANDAKTIVIDTAEATANLFYISGPQTGSATLTIQAAEGVEGAKLTVVDKMLTTGNVTVTQKAYIAVAGTSQMGDGSPIPAKQVVQAGFQVNGSDATYTVESGDLVVQVPGSGSGDVSVSNGAILEVGADATLSADRAIASYFGNAASAASGTLSIAGTATFSTQMGLASQNFTVELAGGIMTTPSVRTFNGLSVSAGSTLAAPEGKELTVSGTNSALADAGDLTLQGKVVFSSAITADYTGELTVADGATVTLGENRPKLSVVEGAKVNITPTAEEQASGRIAFATSMTAVPSATFTVEGVDAVTPEVDNGTLTLSWEASTATLSTTGNWSAPAWKVGETTGQAAPESGVVVLDGTAEGGITVTLDTKLTDEAGASLFQRIFVKGTVNLVITSAQPTLPALAFDTGVTLGVGQRAEGVTETSKFTSAWEMDETMTLDLQGPFDFANAETLGGTTTVVGGNLELSAEGMTYSLGRGNLRVEGSLAVTASNVTIEGLSVVLGDTLMLTGDNITIKGDGNGATIADVAVTSSGNNNAIIGITSPCKTIDVTGGSLTYGNVARSPVARLGGVLLSNGATLKLASDWATGQTLHIAAANNDTTNTVLDMSVVAATNRPTIARWGSSVYRLPKTIVVKPSEAEESANVITLALEAPTDGNPGPALQKDAVADVRSSVQTWVPVIEKSAADALTITNVPAPDGLTGLEEAVALAIRRAAAEAGVKGAYTVQLTTKGQPVEVTADMLNDVLECFTGLKATADGSVLTYAYDFGIVGVKRDTNGWVVTAKVQGADGAEAGFAEGNVYTLTVNGAEYPVQTATVGEGGTVTLPLADPEVQGDGPLTLGVKVARPESTPAQ